MEPLNFILYYPIYGIAVICFFFLIGHIKFLKLEKYSYPIHFIFWWTYIVSLFVVSIVGYKTMLLVPFLLGTFLLIVNRKNLSFESKQTQKLPILIVSFLFFYIFHLYSYNGFDFTSVNNLHGDHVFYGRLSRWMLINKEESMQTILQKGLEYNPYHYFDLWFNSLLLSPFNINAIVSEHILKTPIAQAFVIFNLSWFLKPKKFYLLFIVLFLAPISILHTYIPILKDLDLFHYGFFEIRTNYKYAFVIIGLISNLFIFKTELNPYSKIILSLINAALYPFLLIHTFVLVGLQFINIKKSFIFTLIAILFLNLFLIIKTETLISIKISVVVFYQIFISALIVIILLFFKNKRSVINSLTHYPSLVFLLFIGLIPYLILHKTLDSVQYWAVLFSSSFTILLFLIIVELKSNLLSYALSFIFFLLNKPSVYNINEKLILKKMEHIAEKKIGFYNDLSFNDKSAFNKNFYVFTPVKEIFCVNDTVKLEFATNDKSYLSNDDYYYSYFQQTNYFDFLTSKNLNPSKDAADLFFQEIKCDTILYNY